MRREGRLSVWATALTCAGIALMLLAIMPAPASACIGATALNYDGVRFLYGTMHTATTTAYDGKTIVTGPVYAVDIEIIPVAFTGTLLVEASATSPSDGYGGTWSMMAPVYYTTSTTNTAAVGAFSITGASSTTVHLIVVPSNVGANRYWRVTTASITAGSVGVKLTALRQM